MSKKFETVSSEVIFSNPYWDYRKDEYILPNLESAGYHYVDSKGACLIIPVLGNNTFIFVRQYRYLNKRFSIEFPGGGLNKNFSLYDNARKELNEESGYDAKRLELIGEFNPYNGVTNEICSVFVALDLEMTECSPDKTEEFDIIILSEIEVLEKINKNEIWDGMTLAAWSLFQFSNIRKDIRL